MLVGAAMSASCTSTVGAVTVAVTQTDLKYTANVAIGSTLSWGKLYCKIELDATTTKPTATTLLTLTATTGMTAVMNKNGNIALAGTAAAGASKMYCVGDKVGDTMKTSSTVTFAPAATPATPATTVTITAAPTHMNPVASGDIYGTVTIKAAWANASGGYAVCGFKANTAFTADDLKAGTTPANALKFTLTKNAVGNDFVFKDVPAGTYKVGCVGDAGNRIVAASDLTVASFTMVTMVTPSVAPTAVVSSTVYGTVSGTVTFAKTLGGSGVCNLTAAAKTAWADINVSAKAFSQDATLKKFTTVQTVTFTGIAAGDWYMNCAGKDSVGKSSTKLTIPAVAAFVLLNTVTVSNLKSICVSSVVQSSWQGTSKLTATSAAWSTGKATCALIEGTAASTKAKIDAVAAAAKTTVDFKIMKTMDSSFAFCPKKAKTTYTIQCYGSDTGNVLKSTTFYQEAAMACPAPATNASSGYSMVPSMALVAVLAAFQL